MSWWPSSRPEIPNSAAKAGIELLKSGRGLLRAFLRNSVHDQPASDKKLAITARFKAEIQHRAEGLNGLSYDADFIARLEKTKEALENALVTETSSDFTERVKAYNNMCAMIREVDQKQKQLDRTRLEAMRQQVRTGEVLSQSKLKRPSVQRTLAIAKYEDDANMLLSLLK